MKKLPEKLEITNKVVRYANKMAGFYGHPVYLVGSHLTDDNPRDIDLVCIIPDDEFKIRYFPSWYLGEDTLKDEIDKFYLGIHTGIHDDEHWYFYRDLQKKSLVGTKFLFAPLDFKVEAQSYSDSHFQDKPRLRVDTRPY